MENKKQKWDYNSVIEIAKICSSFKEFTHKYSGAYNAAYRNKWLDDIRNLFIVRELHSWTFDEVLELAKGCRYLLELRKKNKRAYDYAMRHKWLQEISTLANLCPLRVRLDDNQIEEIKEKFSSGLKCKLIAKEYGIHEQTVEHLLIWLGLLDKQVAWKRNGSKRKYTEEYILAESIKYRSQKELFEANRGLGDAIRKYHLEEKAYAHMPYWGKIKWTKRRCEEIAKKCKTADEMQKKFSCAYSVAYRNRWLDDLFPQKSHNHKPYTKNECKTAALTCSTIDEFKDKFNYLYIISCERKWLDDIVEHMPTETKHKHTKWKKWTDEAAALEAKKYTSRTEFRRGCHGAALYASTRPGLMDKICAHMPPKGTKKTRCIYVAEFSDNHVYIGLTYNVKRRWKDHLSGENSSAVYEHITATSLTPIFKIIHDFVPEENAGALEQDFIDWYSANGWIILNKVKAGGLGSKKMKFTFELIIEIVKKCHSYKEFRTQHSTAYKTALYCKWLDKVKEILPPLIHVRTPEEITALAKECKTHQEFREKYIGAYEAAKRLSIYDKITSHMPPLRTFWNEINILEEAKKWSSANAFRKANPSAYRVAKKIGIYDDLVQIWEFK